MWKPRQVRWHRGLGKRGRSGWPHQTPANWSRKKTVSPWLCKGNRVAWNVISYSLYACGPPTLNTYDEILTPKMVLGGRTFRRCLSHEVETSYTELMPYKWGSRNILSPLHVRAQQRGTSYESGRRLVPECDHAGTLILTPRPPDLWEGDFCCLWITQAVIFCYSSPVAQDLIQVQLQYRIKGSWVVSSGKDRSALTLSYGWRPRKRVDLWEGLWRSGGIRASVTNRICRGLFISKHFQEPLKSHKSLTIFQQPTQRPLSLLCTSKNSPLGCSWPEILAFCVKTLGHYFQADAPVYKWEEVPLLIGSVLTYLLLAKECVRTWTVSQRVCWKESLWFSACGRILISIAQEQAAAGLKD